MPCMCWYDPPEESNKIEECFKETAFVPFEPFYDSSIQSPNWKS